MTDLFFQGGPLFMGILTLLLLGSSAWMTYHFLAFIKSREADTGTALRFISYGRSIGLFALIFGIFGQLIGFYDAFSYLETTPVSPQVLSGGIKVSMIPTMYGIIIYIISLILWFALSQIIEKRSGDN
ncbi:MotA/TolQ/ExbB proton channel family protein [Carboxylicivirga sp. RSCT41]|uniref:MotA/TolQ/ExbB proton channel family protein n=1 Tax=Carboxylicivirga agarovorans TaxID=3417570 RepID=UPI003D3385FF